MRKVGGLYHWKFGPLGGSFYLRRGWKPPLIVEIVGAMTLGAPLGVFMAWAIVG